MSLAIIPRISFKRLSIVLPSLSLLTILIYVMFYSNFVNIANYSFLTFDFSGKETSNPLFSLIKYSRLPILFFGFFGLLIVLPKNRALRSFLLTNWDILLFMIVIYFGLINSIDLFNGVSYSLWHSASFLSILSLIYLLKTKYQEQIYEYFFRFIFWSNFLVLPLLYINLPTLGNNWVYHMAFSAKTFYPYCLLSMLMAIFGSQLFLGKSLFGKKWIISTFWIELFFIVSICLFCFVSARRTPLFVIFILTFAYIFFAIGKRIWKKAMLVLIVIGVLFNTIPKALIYMEENKTELAILNKLTQIQESSGNLSKDPSYNERQLVWISYFEVIKRFPILGTGSFNGPIYQEQMFSGSREGGFSPHNLYIGILTEHGIIGFLIFLIVLFRSWTIYFIKNGTKKTWKYTFFLLTPVLLINWNEYNLIPGQVFYWTTLLILFLPRHSLIR